MKSTIGASIRDRASRGSSRATPRSVVPLASARSEARWITGPSASGSENGTPTSITSAPLAGQRDQDLGGAREIRIAGRHVGHEPGLSRGADAGEGVGDARHQRAPSSAAWTLSTSLSPRPERLTSRIASFGSSGASRQACAIACDDSSAGRMPSSRPSRWNAVERRRVVDPGVFGAADLAQPGVLGPDRRVVEPGRDRVGQLDVAVVVLQHVAARALQHAGAAAGEARRVLARRDAAPAGLDADQAHLLDPR